MLSDVARAYLTGFRDGTRAASLKPAPANRTIGDDTPRIGFKLLVSETNSDRAYDDGVKPCHDPTIPPMAAA